MSKCLRTSWSATTCLLLCLLVAATQPASTQTRSGRETTAASVASYPLSADMPVDPEVLIGGLPNGLRFYIRRNPASKQVDELTRQDIIRAANVFEWRRKMPKWTVIDADGLRWTATEIRQRLALS